MPREKSEYAQNRVEGEKKSNYPIENSGIQYIYIHTHIQSAITNEHSIRQTFRSPSQSKRARTSRACVCIYTADTEREREAVQRAGEMSREIVSVWNLSIFFEGILIALICLS